MGEVVGAEGEELGRFGNLARGQRRTGEFDHGAELVLDADLSLREHALRRPAYELGLPFELLDIRHQRDHHLGEDLDPLTRHLARSFEDRFRLHFGNLRKSDSQAAPPVAEHRVRLRQDIHEMVQSLEGHIYATRETVDFFLPVREELVQWRIEQPDRDRETAHCAKDPREVLPLHG